MAPQARLIRRVRLQLDPPPVRGGKLARDGLSAVLVAGEHLWLANDEGAGLDRLTRATGGQAYTDHVTFMLTHLLDLPRQDTGADEIDIEGMDLQDDTVWLVGSHTWTRDKPHKALEKGGDPFAALADIDPNPNRHVLACLPLLSGGEVPRAAEGAAYPSQPGVARLKIGRRRGALAKALRHDPLLGGFLDLPSKENGLDIEGIAASGDRLLLGLRGPVLAGYAFVLEIQVREAKPGRLKLDRIGPDGERYRRHGLFLGGNGIRDMCWQGDDLLILAGPTAKTAGRCYVWRWRQARVATGRDQAFHDRTDDPDGEEPLRRVMELPVGDHGDHPEGMALLDGAGGEPASLLVVYDAPLPDRCVGEAGVYADVLALP